MNAWFAGGVLAGILAVAIYGVLKKRKESAPRYDERRRRRGPMRRSWRWKCWPRRSDACSQRTLCARRWAVCVGGAFLETVVLLLIAGHGLRIALRMDGRLLLRFGKSEKRGGASLLRCCSSTPALGIMVILDGEL